jgi:predicted DsbA family dithiol-disulfide isomerase
MRDAMYAASAQIDGTPTYIIGNQVAAVGARSFDEWKTILDKAIQDVAAKKKQP